MLNLYKNLYLYLKGMDKQVAIKLTPDEQKIFTMLKQYRNELGLKTVLRVAGGWVRDKVLGKQSKDIDIALDNMKGQQFVTLLKKHAEKSEHKISGFGVTKFNPEQSKLLETATAKIDNHWIDFVNLRSQQYREDSRIPIIIFGTPLQDAQRRDFTINSLFYNLQTEEVEDFTGKGLEDLNNQIIRTPLKPSITFRDDPLRILRCLRFKSRLDFQVDKLIYEAITLPQIQEALLRKVSKERVGIQLGGLLKAKHFFSGLEDIKNYGLWNIVFEVPQKCDLFTNKEILQKIPQFSYNVTQLFIKSLGQKSWVTQKQLTTEEEESEQKPKDAKNKKIQYSASQLQFNILISSLTFVYRTYDIKVGKTKSNLLVYMIKDQLKYAAKYAKFSMHFAESVDKLMQLKSTQSIYEIVRWLRFAEEKWQLAIHFCNAFCQVTNQKPAINLFDLRDFILKNQIGDCYLTESPVDGTYITKKGIKGPIISKILQNATIWRITNPNQPKEAFQKAFESNPEFFSSENTYK